MNIKYIFENLLLAATIFFFIKNSIAEILIGNNDNNFSNNMNCDKIIPTMNLINGCFTNKYDPIVVVENNSHYKCKKVHVEENPNVVIRLSFNESYSKQQYINKQKNLKIDPSAPTFKKSSANKFLLVNINEVYLTIVLQKLKMTKWWNSNGVFIIENTQLNRNCEIASEYLNVLWKFNILRAVHFCTDNNLKTQMYTFNPYNSKAPINWVKQYSLITSDGYYITFFKQQYNETTDACKSSNFERTSVVSNYAIKLYCMKSFYNPNISTAFKIEGELGEIAATIWNFLNASIRLTIVDNNGIIDENGFATNALADVIDGKFDMSTVYDYQRDIWQYELNTFISSGQCYVTKYKSMLLVEYLSKLLSSTFFGVIFVYILITVFFHAFFVKITHCEAALDVIRMAVGTSMLNTTNLLSGRLFFMWNALVIIFTTMYFQPELYALFTSYPPHPINITTSDDLLFKYKVYAINYTKQYFINRSIYEKILHVNNFEECLSLMYKSEDIACPTDCLLLQSFPLNLNEVKVSNDVLIRRYFVLTYREDFPLRKRVQQIYHRMYQHGLIHYIQRFVPKHISKSQFSRSATGIGFKNLGFTFHFYGVFVIASLTVLIAEILTTKVLVMLFQTP